MKAIIIYSLALAALTSCAKSEEVTTPDNPTPLQPKEIHISAAIEASAQTKAVTRDAVTLTGPIDGNTDIEGIQFLRKNATNSDFSNGVLSFDGATLVTGKRTATNASSGGGDITFATVQTYDQKENKNAYFVAYYPVRENSSSSDNTATWTIDGKTDILYAERYDAGSYTSITSGSTMTFKHALAQIRVICKGATGAAQDVIDDVWGKITKIEIETKAKATYTYATQKFAYEVNSQSPETTDKLPLLGSNYQALTTEGVQIPADITAAGANDNNGDDGAIAAGMFAPDDNESSTAPIKLTITTKKDNAETTSGPIEVQLMNGSNENAAFVSGKKHTVTLTFNSKEKNITVTKTEVAAWGTGYTGTGSVTPKENDSSQGS